MTTLFSDPVKMRPETIDSVFQDVPNDMPAMEMIVCYTTSQDPSARFYQKVCEIK